MNQIERAKDEIMGFKVFDAKTEAKVLSALSKWLTEKNEVSADSVAKKESVCVMCPANVSMVIAKTEEAKRALARFVEEKERNIPTLNYIPKEEEHIISMYSVEYLTYALNLLKIDGWSVTMQMRKDYPMTLENDQFKVIIAPRIEAC